jgi:hypothetical protein
MTVIWQLRQLEWQYRRREESDINKERKLSTVLSWKSITKNVIYVSRIEPLSAPNVFGFIALQDEIWILERWIRFTKNSQIKTDITSVGWDPIKMDLKWKIKTK